MPDDDDKPKQEPAKPVVLPRDPDYVERDEPEDGKETRQR